MTSINQPLFSVGIPCYERPEDSCKYLQSLSLENQKDACHEIIVTTDSPKVVIYRRWSAEFPNKIEAGK